MYLGPMDGVINEQASVSSMLGISPANGRMGGYEASSLPASTYVGRDRGAIPWSGDSALFWGAIIGGLTLLGIVGASVNVRAGKAHAGVSINDK